MIMFMFTCLLLGFSFVAMCYRAALDEPEGRRRSVDASRRGSTRQPALSLNKQPPKEAVGEKMFVGQWLL